MGPYAGTIAPPVTSEQEAEILKGQVKYFENALEEIKKRIADLESKQEEK
jgi:predicted  nucleic acid-binding Zn-ribbon protein